VPGKQEPGKVAVTQAPGAKATNGAVELILDASGSMLQKLGATRRIDIAKQTLAKLTSATIPAGTAVRAARIRPRSGLLSRPTSTCPWVRSIPPPWAHASPR
jgi:hypothetical protein